MGNLNLILPNVGDPNATADPAVKTALQAIQTLVNGNLDGTNLYTALADVLSVSQGATARRGYALVATAETTAALSASDLATVGPDVTITCPASGGLVFLYPYAEILLQAGSVSPASIMFFRDGVQLEYNSSVGRVFMTGGSTGGYVPTVPTNAAPFVLPESAGSHTYRMKYGATAGHTASFRNRQLWAWVMGF